MGDVREIMRTAEMYPACIEPTVEQEYVDDEDPTVTLGFVINDVPTADWALSRYGALKRQEADVDAMVEAAIARIQHRAEKMKANIRKGLVFFESRLAEYASREKKSLLGGGKKKSRDLLNGTLGWRKKGGKLVVTDKAALIAWLEQQPPECGLFRMKVEPEMKAIQEQFKTSGEIPPGCDFELEEEAFYVKVPETALVKE